VIFNERNAGFAAAQNQAIREARGNWVLTLNPDVLLLPGFIGRLVEAGQADARIGTVCGKLLTMTAEFEIPPQPVVDSTGIYFNPMLRHLDRGSQQPDNGHYREPEFVFGATAAAALYRRAMIEDISLEGEFFDSDFFIYREDADVAWRAQLMGWRCLYTPHARGYHVRTVLPGNRAALPSTINMHSVKNRYLMRIKNISWPLYCKNWFSITFRDAVVVGCCLLWEQTSLPAFWYLVRNWRRAVHKRALVQQRRRVSDEALADWFNYHPVSHQAPPRAVPRPLTPSRQTVKT
jgi:GT2 family glycosyltransferase